jgi:hypothetical protein
MHRYRTSLAGAVTLAAGLLALALVHGRGVAAPGRSCGMATFSKNGVVYKVLFAKNGAVQQYLLASNGKNTELNHDILKAAEAAYGPEGVNAPPLQIQSFRPGPNGMMVPDKAVDSCGRITHFH